MDIKILHDGPFSSATIDLQPSEQFVSEAGAMFHKSSNVTVNVTTQSKGGSGGLLGGVKRMLAAESFFFSTYHVANSSPGQVGLAPTHVGSIRKIDVDQSTPWICTGGSYLGSGTGVKIDTQFQGIKGMFSGESLSFVRASGEGPMLISAFGNLAEYELNGELIVDTGHVVAYTDTLQYEVTKVGTSWLNSWLAGEGIVLKFSGKGRIITQSHNLPEFGRMLGPLLPEK